MNDEKPPAAPQSSWSVIVVSMTAGAYFVCLVFFLQSNGLAPATVTCFKIGSPAQLIAPDAVSAADLALLSTRGPDGSRARSPRSDLPGLALSRRDWSAFTGIAALSTAHRARHSRGRMEEISTPLLQ